jgi:ABC-type nickel/cobalt efflux system permease component RcnA
VLTSLLLLGFFMGMRHALEADHLATVASLATRSARLRDVVRVAGVWGLGHAAVLVALGTAAALAGFALSDAAARSLETGVGVVLVALGIDVLRRARQRRVHVHPHRHADGTWHVHAHAHEPSHDHAHAAAHDHGHARGLAWRALAVGALHGGAGSAALLLVSVPSFGPLRGLAYVGVYALGSVLGMLLLSLAVSLPLRWSAPALGRVRWAFETALGSASVALGVVLVVRIWNAAA